MSAMIQFLMILQVPLTYWTVLAVISIHRDANKGRI